MNLELLSRIAAQPFEACEAEWKEVLGGLRLGLIYVPAIQTVLKEGRWKEAPNPAAYVRKAARRAAVRLGLVDRRPQRDREVLACELKYEDEQGQALGHDDRLGTALHRHKEKYGRVYAGDAHWAENRVHMGVYTEEPEIDWERVGDLAGLDAAERLVMELQLAGFGRDTALGACLTDRDRRYLQAAWKRYERDRQRLSRALQTGKPRRARKTQTQWPELELIFVVTDEGELKISFKKVVPEGRF
ncbi:MAG TPA: hypothetical protein VFR84_01820 [Candidatus Angelobacter sp.]|nr:hypothetical protein [Candidatus Angelobacter sp.]